MVSKMLNGKKTKRARRSFDDAYKASVVKLVIDEGKSVAQVARDLDLTASAVGGWVAQARADRGNGKPGALTSAEREELANLRKENRTLKMERDILKKAAVSSHGECNTWYDAADGATRTSRTLSAAEEETLDAVAQRSVA